MQPMCGTSDRGRGVGMPDGPIALVRAGDVFSAGTMNALIEHVNALSRGERDSSRLALAALGMAAAGSPRKVSRRSLLGLTRWFSDAS